MTGPELVGSRLVTNPPREIINGLTAILLHAEAIRRRSASRELPSSEIADSAMHIANDARRISHILERLKLL